MGTPLPENLEKRKGGARDDFNVSKIKFSLFPECFRSYQCLELKLWPFCRREVVDTYGHVF